MVLPLTGIVLPVLAAVRIAAMLAFTPLLTAAPMPVTARVLLVMGLAIAMSLGLSHTYNAIPPAIGNLVPAILAEFSIGLLMALGIFCAFAAFSFAGHVLDLQIGYAIGQIYDPVSSTQTSILASAFAYLGVVLFFVLDVHHAVLRALAYTFELVPVGTFMAGNADVAGLIASSAKLFSLGFMLVAPIVFCILLIEVGLGVVSRGMPHMNVFVIALPIKILAGLLLLSLWASHMPAGMQRIYALTFDVWQRTLR